MLGQGLRVTSTASSRSRPAQYRAISRRRRAQDGCRVTHHSIHPAATAATATVPSRWAADRCPTTSSAMVASTAETASRTYGATRKARWSRPSEASSWTSVCGTVTEVGRSLVATPNGTA